MHKPGIIVLFATSVIATQASAGDLKGSIKLGFVEDEIAAMEQVKIDIVEAISIAKKKVDGRVIEAELENEDGYLVWEVEILDQSKQEHEIIIDPVTGNVLLEAKRD